MTVPKQKLLLVEDDPGLSFVLVDNLQRAGYDVTHTASGEQAITLFSDCKFDLCLLDVMLPKVDGFSLAANFRRTNADVPILFITARSLQEDKLRAFSLGADDYITKPFSMEELLFRVAVFIKRASASGSAPALSAQVQVGAYVLNTDALTLQLNGHSTKLTRRENDLLLMLVNRKNQVVRREDILLKLWGDDDYFAGRSLDVFVSRLRKYLKQDHSVQIENHHSVGFQLKVRQLG